MDECFSMIQDIMTQKLLSTDKKDMNGIKKTKGKFQKAADNER